METPRVHAFIETGEVRPIQGGESYTISGETIHKRARTYVGGTGNFRVVRRLPGEAIVMWRWRYPNGDWSDHLRWQESDCPAEYHRERILLIPFTDPEPEPEDWIKEAAQEWANGSVFVQDAGAMADQMARHFAKARRAAELREEA